MSWLRLPEDQPLLRAFLKGRVVSTGGVCMPGEGSLSRKPTLRCSALGPKPTHGQGGGPELISRLALTPRLSSTHTHTHTHTPTYTLTHPVCTSVTQTSHHSLMCQALPCLCAMVHSLCLEFLTLTCCLENSYASFKTLCQLSLPKSQTDSAVPSSVGLPPPPARELHHSTL